MGLLKFCNPSLKHDFQKSVLNFTDFTSPFKPFYEDQLNNFLKPNYELCFKQFVDHSRYMPSS